MVPAPHTISPTPAIDYVLVLIPRDGIGCGEDKVRTGEVLGAARAFIIYIFKRVATISSLKTRQLLRLPSALIGIP